MKIFVPILCMMAFLFGLNADDIDGFWKTVTEKNEKSYSVIAIYEYKGKRYGKIIATYANGVMKDNLYMPTNRAPGVFGNPFYCGMDMIWDLRKDGDRYKGKILDPEKGNLYNAELWVKDGKLVVRGKVLFIGKNQTWRPAEPSDFPKSFKMPDTKTFVPNIPQV